MAHIQTRNTDGGRQYVVRYRDSAGRERSRTFTRRRDAETLTARLGHARAMGWTIDDQHPGADTTGIVDPTARSPDPAAGGNGLTDLPGVHIYRHELLFEFRRALRWQQQYPDRSLATCAWEVRDLTRRRGRPPRRLSVTRPVLAKGLQFDRVLVLDSNAFRDARDLYVAITRASTELVMIGHPDALPVPLAAEQGSKP